MDSSFFERKHDDADARASRFAFLIDAWDGTGGFAPPLDEIVSDATHGSTMNDELLPDWKWKSYIDRFPREEVGKWRARVRRAHYTNVVRSIGETLCGFLLRRMPTRTTTDELLLAFEADADGLGTSWDDLVRHEIARRLWLFGCPLLLVNRPDDDADSRADAGRTYVTPVYPQSLYDWETGSAGELLWAKLVDVVTSCGGADEARETYTRAVEWTRTGWRRWIKRAGQDPTFDAEGSHPCGRVPLVVGSMSRPIGVSILGTSEAYEISDEARKLYNYQSLLDEHLYNQVYAVLAVVMPEFSRAEGFKLGTDNALVMQAGGSASYLAPPASVADVLFRAIDTCIRRIYRAARLEFTMRDSGQAESGVSRQYEFSATNRALASMASELARIERETQRLVLLWDGKDESAVDDILAEQRVAWPDDFDVRDLERELKLTLDLMLLPIGDTAKAAALRTVRDDLVSLTDEEREKSNEEIEAEFAVAKEPPPGSPPPPPAEEPEEQPEDEEGGEEEGEEAAPEEGAAPVGP